VRQSMFIVGLLVVVCALTVFAADRKIISAPGTKPGGNNSQGILSKGALYISGQGGEDAAGRIPNDFDAEVRHCLDNIEAVLKAAGMSPAEVVSFKEPRPTRTTVVVAGLAGQGTLRLSLLPRNRHATWR
jgi:hypothetical protein